MKTSLLLLVSSVLLLRVCVFAETCPGGRVRCPDFMTCCHISDDDFGCCPFPNAKCCLDRIHCCPHNMDCDVTHQSCVRKGSSVHLYWQVPLHPEVIEPVIPEVIPELPKEEENGLHHYKNAANQCPDKSVCHETFTCCKMYSGKFGCCPFDNGTCCLDGFHCCPHGSKCTSSGDCYSSEMNYTVNAYPLQDKKYERTLSLKKTLGKPPHQDVSDPGGICPDGHSCPEKYTCCKIDGKRFGCCPLTDAVCCDDGIHCCPKGTNCNTTLGTCDIQKNFGWSFPVRPLENIQLHEGQEVEDVVCPDERYHCPSGMTCCQLESGAYGCCPLERATCCSDKEHCCPHGYVCDGDDCSRGSARLPPFLWTPPKFQSVKEKQVVSTGKPNIEETVLDVICPDDYPCPDRNTCCQLASGEYGCCPMEKATCCADKIHCCPHGYNCVNDGCRKESNTSSEDILLATIIGKKPKDGEPSLNVGGASEDTLGDICPDEKSDCPDGTTCCELESGDYGCCYYENATCCGDKIHCCPHGYWCTEEGCDRMPGMPQHSVAFLQKIARSTEHLKEAVQVAMMP